MRINRLKSVNFMKGFRIILNLFIRNTIFSNGLLWDYMEVSKEELQIRVDKCTELINVLCFLNVGSVLVMKWYILPPLLFPYIWIHWSAFNKIAEIDSKPATLPKKVYIEEVSCKCIRIFIASLKRSNLGSLFSKIASLFKGSSTTDFSLKIFLLRQLISGRYSKKSMWQSQYIVELHSVQCRLACNLTKINSIEYTLLH